MTILLSWFGVGFVAVLYWLWTQGDKFTFKRIRELYRRGARPGYTLMPSTFREYIGERIILGSLVGILSGVLTVFTVSFGDRDIGDIS